MWKESVVKVTVIYFILILGIIIAVHEFGHLIAAKLFNVYVTEYAIGFGPKIFSKTTRETVYSLRVIPLGGFTGMVENEETPLEFDENGNPTKVLNVEKGRTFYGVSPWKRIMILLAGPLFNIILACLVFVLVFQITGFINEYPKPYIEQVVANSPAEQAGLMSGDLITKITYSSGREVVPETFYDIVIENQTNNKEMTLEVLRDGKTVTVKVTPELNPEDNSYKIGIIGGSPVARKLSFLEAIPTGISYGLETLKLTFNSIVGLFNGSQSMDSLGGTIAIYKYTEEAASYGLPSLLSLMGSLSVSVGLMNLVPIPIFDGGKIVLTLFEIITGKRTSEKVETVVTYIGLGLVFALFIFVTYQDIVKLILGR